jgi:hypothetical protein
MPTDFCVKRPIFAWSMSAFRCFGMIYDDNGKPGLPRGMPLVASMAELQANMRGIQWHPRVQNPVGKRVPYMLELNVGHDNSSGLLPQ